jgi:hypothetical protein
MTFRKVHKPLKRKGQRNKGAEGQREGTQNGDIKALSTEIGALRQELTLFQTFVNRQFDAIDKRFYDLKHDIDKRFDLADDAANQRFNAMDKRPDGIDKRIDDLAGDWRLSLDVHQRLAAIEARLEKR